MNSYPIPRIDAASLQIHAARLATMTKTERAAYLEDFSGKRTPAPKKYADGERGKSLADLLGKAGVADLLKRADELSVTA